MATTNVMKKRRTKNAMMASHIGDGHGPAVATGTAVTSEAAAATASTPVQLGCVAACTPRKYRNKNKRSYHFDNRGSDVKLTCTISVVVFRRQGRASGVTRREVRHSVCSANRLDVVRRASASEVARRVQIHLQIDHEIIIELLRFRFVKIVVTEVLKKY